MTLTNASIACWSGWLRLASERNHQAIDRQMRHVTHVVTKLRLAKILRKMPRADMNVRALGATL